jgi:WD40 repeat protein
MFNDLSPSNLKLKMEAHTESCTCAIYNPIGDMIATGGADKVVKLWTQKKMTMIHEIKHKNFSI